MIYYVSKKGSDQNMGTEDAPFLTIQKAADIAAAGDKVIVFGGEYREWVNPCRGGINESCRVIYEAAAGERPVIKGSEIVTDWEKEGNIWKKEVPNSIFGEFNPFREKIFGDWIIDPRSYDVHRGDVYLNGVSLFEARSLEEVENPILREYSPHETWDMRKEKIWNPQNTLYVWFAQVEEKRTVLYANFGDRNPNQELIEISVRPCCFYPKASGVNYITVRGFEMAQAATPWAPPTGNQVGMIGPNWSKGWVIEDNVLHDAKCSAISLGKEASTGDNDFSKWHRKPGYQYQMEAVFRARNIGWGKERVGSHIVRNNVIYDCGQNGIVGHMGCAFSKIYNNEIYRIAKKHEFYGHEIAGIKLHAAIDVQITGNCIHHCSLGTWLDWQAQGVRVNRNVYYQNDRDFMIEVTHGPYLIDNNIFGSEYNFVNAAQGGAYVHNLCCGFTEQYPVLDRATPYHLPHSTEVLGTVPVYGSDDRWYQNIFVGGTEEDKRYHYGTAYYNGSAASMEDYIQTFFDMGGGDVETYAKIKQPCYIDSNVYLNGAERYEKESNYACTEEDAEILVSEENDGVWLTITLPHEISTLPTKLISTEILGAPRIVEARYENADGTSLNIDLDLMCNRIEENPVPGPLQSLKPGKNRILIWQRDSRIDR